MAARFLKPSVVKAALGLTLATALVAPKAQAGPFDWLFGGDEQPQALPQPQWQPAPPPKAPKPKPATTAPKANESAVDEFRNQPRFDLPVVVTKVEWTEKDENDFGRFVAQLGKAIQAKKCGSVKKCMRMPEANMFAENDPEGLVLYSDCADFPYFLRAYFAYHRGLPMEFVKEIALNKQPYSSEPNRDDDLATARLDNSPYGNRVVSRTGANLPQAPGYELNLIDYLERLYDTVSTRTLRVGPLSPKYDLADFYPVRINRDGIRPGTVVHSTGHAYVVFDVDAKGTVHMIDAHPDGSISKKELKASTLDRSRPDHGLGLFRFRPLRVSMSQQYSNGVFYGGKLIAASDEELYESGKWSLEQWFGPGSKVAPKEQVDPAAWKNGFKKQNFFDYVSVALRGAGVVVSADEEVGDVMKSLCTEFQQRVDDVDLALTKKHNLNRVPHPSALPQNIFSAEQPWEDTSTPSRDGRMKAAVEDIIKVAVSKFRQAKQGVAGVSFNGSAEDYVAALRGRLAGMDKSCQVTYTNSSGQKVRLTFQQVVSRLNRLSFDPYHCAEKRWGASGKELATCVDQDKGNVWYDAQAYMRNTVGKTTATERLIIRSDRPITLEMLRDASLIDQPDESPINLGTQKAPITDLDKNFSSEKFLQLLTK